MSQRCVLAVAATIVALTTAGCALTQKAKPLDVSYYTPERVGPGVMSAQAASAPALRLVRVASGTHLGERIVYGDGAYQVHYYDGRRWTERPEVYVRRSLGRVLFEEAGFHRAVSGDAPTLDVEVLSFEEVKTPAQHAARIVLHAVLSADHVLLEETLATSEPVAVDDFDAFVAAMARSLDRSSNEVACRVGSALGFSATGGSARSGACDRDTSRAR
jgi:cholesterol transport system auxiliary component